MEGDDVEMGADEEERLPVLTRETLKGWQKAILEVCLSNIVQRRFNANGVNWSYFPPTAATITACTPKIIDCVPFSITYERRRSSVGLEYR